MHARQLTWTLMSWCILRQQALKDRREPSYLLPRDGTMLATITSISSIQDLPLDWFCSPISSIRIDSILSIFKFRNPTIRYRISWMRWCITWSGCSPCRIQPMEEYIINSPPLTLRDSWCQKIASSNAMWYRKPPPLLSTLLPPWHWPPESTKNSLSSKASANKP